MIIFYPTIYMASEHRSPQGYSSNAHIFTLHSMIAAHILTILRFMYQTYGGVFMTVGVAVDLFALCLQWIVQLNLKDGNSIFELCIIQIVDDTTTMIAFLLTIGLAFVVNWFIWECVYLIKDYPIYIFLRRTLSDGEDIRSVGELNCRILDTFVQYPDIIDIVRSCFGVKDGKQQ